MKKIKTPSELEVLRQAIISKRDPTTQIVKVCCSTGCRAGGSLNIIDAFKQEIPQPVILQELRN